MSYWSWWKRTFDGNLPMRGRPTWERLITFALFGAVMGTLFDWTHVHFHAAEYHPSVWIARWLPVGFWVPIEFAGACALIGIGHPQVDEWLRWRPIQLKPKWVLMALMGFGAVWTASGFLSIQYGSNVIVSTLLLGVAWTMYGRYDGTLKGLVPSFATMLIGVVVEVIVVSVTDKYAYTSRAKEVIGTWQLPVPLWLPSLYLAGSVAIGNWGRAMARGWDDIPDPPQGAEQPTT